MWGPAGSSQVSLSTQQKGSNLFILMLIEYNEDPGFSNMGIIGDLGESGSVELVGLEKVSERMRELDQRSMDTLWGFVLQRERKKMRQYMEREAGSRVCLCLRQKNSTFTRWRIGSWREKKRIKKEVLGPRSGILAQGQVHCTHRCCSYPNGLFQKNSEVF